MATATAIAAGKPMRLVLAAMALALAQTASAQTVVPDPTITPGAVRTVDPAEICSADTRGLRHGSRLKVLVCGGELDVIVAQREIAEDWTAAWQRYVGAE
jgi:hypothetical protein